MLWDKNDYFQYKYCNICFWIIYTCCRIIFWSLLYSTLYSLYVWGSYKKAKRHVIMILVIPLQNKSNEFINISNTFILFIFLILFFFLCELFLCLKEAPLHCFIYCRARVTWCCSVNTNHLFFPPFFLSFFSYPVLSGSICNQNYDIHALLCQIHFAFLRWALKMIYKCFYLFF